VVFFPLWRCGPTRAMASSFFRFLDHTQRHITVGRTPLDEWSARRRDLYLTTHNTRNRQTSMPQVGFEPTISAAARPLGPALSSDIAVLISTNHKLNMQCLSISFTVYYADTWGKSMYCRCLCIFESLHYLLVPMWGHPLSFMCVMNLVYMNLVGLLWLEFRMS